MHPELQIKELWVYGNSLSVATRIPPFDLHTLVLRDFASLDSGKRWLSAGGSSLRRLYISGRLHPELVSDSFSHSLSQCEALEEFVLDEEVEVEILDALPRSVKIVGFRKSDSLNSWANFSLYFKAFIQSREFSLETVICAYCELEWEDNECGFPPVLETHQRLVNDLPELAQILHICETSGIGVKAIDHVCIHFGTSHQA